MLALVFKKNKIPKHYNILCLNVIFMAVLFCQQYIHLLYLLIISVITFYTAKILIKLKRNSFKNFIFWSVCLFNFFILAITKYESVSFLQEPILIVGISYFIFKLVHFLYEVKIGTINNFSFINFINFLFFFAAFISGPIDRYSRFESDMKNNVQLQIDIFILFRLILGLFKKIVLTQILIRYSVNNLSIDTLLILDWQSIVIGAFAYTFIMYFDFSGYSDMSISVSKIFGINTPENFNNPFISLSIQEFWTRWHITLSSWIRDYIFNPIVKLLIIKYPSLNINIVSSVSIFIAFTLSGIWHGDGLNYIIWGALHGLALAFYSTYRLIMKKQFKKQYKTMNDSFSYNILSWCITFLFIVFTLFIFSMNFDQLKVIFWGE